MSTKPQYPLEHQLQLEKKETGKIFPENEQQHKVTKAHKSVQIQAHPKLPSSFQFNCTTDDDEDRLIKKTYLLLL